MADAHCVQTQNWHNCIKSKYNRASDAPVRVCVCVCVRACVACVRGVRACVCHQIRRLCSRPHSHESVIFSYFRHS